MTFEENTWRPGEREEVCLGNSNERALWLLACLACAVKAVTECHEPGGERDKTREVAGMAWAQAWCHMTIWDNCTDLGDFTQRWGAARADYGERSNTFQVVFL